MRNRIYACLLVIVLHSAALSQTTQQRSSVINGQVLDDQGRPVAGVVVSAHPDAGLRGKVPTSSSDARGEFTISVSQTGSFTVSASKQDDGYPPSSNPFYYPSDDSVARVSVGADQAPPFATVRLLPKAGKLLGAIVDGQTGQPVEVAIIDLCRAEAPRYCHRVPATSRAGQFTFLAPSAPFTIQISASGYQGWYGADGVDRQLVPLQVGSGTTKTLKVSLKRVSAQNDDIASPSVLEAPQPLSPVADAEFEHYPRITKLEWSAVPGAASYTVELEVCEPRRADGRECEGRHLLQMRENPPLSGIEGTSYEFRFIGAQPGRWRVNAVDAKGRVGEKSAWSKFFYRR